jgi:ATP-dependent HslUV protease ATP-binding subunit HslU
MLASLDTVIVGQTEAKRSLVMAIRTRERRRLLDPGLARKVQARHLLLAGPTGVGKTALVERAATFLELPYLRVEVARFLGNGAIRDLAKTIVEELLDPWPEQMEDGVATRVEERAIILLDDIDCLLPEQPDSDQFDLHSVAVQKALLQLLDGSAVSTSRGLVPTADIIFVAAGAFSMSRVHDLLPEFVGRFSYRAECEALGREELRAILALPAFALDEQTAALLAQDAIQVVFRDDGLDEIVAYAIEANTHVEDLGARRLVSLIDAIAARLSFDDPPATGSVFEIDAAFVAETLGEIGPDQDLSQFIL